jgi:transposase
VGYFAGLDLSLEETAICIVDDAGRIVREARAVSEPEALVAFFTGYGMTMERVGLKACNRNGRKRLRTAIHYHMCAETRR